MKRRSIIVGLVFIIGGCAWIRPPQPRPVPSPSAVHDTWIYRDLTKAQHDACRG